jgi:glycosyltransferase involved in cell wall biosynthesis
MLRSFLQQTYPNRELLIVSDGEDVRDLAEGLPGVRLIHVAEARQIGAKRNFGCGRAQGEVVCHFDDDDYSAPERIEAQVAALEAHPGKSVTGFHSMKFTDGGTWWKYSGGMHYALGTSLCYLRAFQQAHPFPALQVGEDNGFVGTAWALNELHTDDAGELMHATIHAGNTSPRSIGSAWTRL